MSTSTFAGRPFCFVHIPKTAGVTLTHLLEAHCSPCWTDEGLRQSIFHHSSDLLNRAHAILFWHITYPDLEHWYGRRAMDPLHSFAFIRNPWDWLVSMYHYVRDPKNEHYEQMIVGHMTFENFLHYWRAKNLQQADFIGRHGQIGVKKLYRFETMTESLAELANDIGIPPPKDVPHLNPSERGDYRTYYTPAMSRMVREICPLDIELGGYDF